MTTTNFTRLTTEQKTVWSRDLWKQARNISFVNSFLGEGPNALVQHITDLTKTERGTRAVMTLVPDLEGDGVAGDRALKGNEEQIKAFDRVIQIDSCVTPTSPKAVWLSSAPSSSSARQARTSWRTGWQTASTSWRS